MRVKRNLHNKILKLLDLFPVVVLTGVRQSGKTTLAREVKPAWRYVDLEASANYEFIAPDPGLFLKQYPNAVIFDEAQRLPKLFAELRHVIDQDRSQKGRYLLTGSSSPDLIAAISESLAGRAATIEIGTLKINERFNTEPSPLYKLLELGNIESSILSLITPQITHQQLMKHWFEGGYPEPALSDNSTFKEVWFEEYISRYIERDLRRLFPGLNMTRYQRFVSFLANLSGQIINQSDLARALEISSPTVKDYIDIATGTFLWRSLTSYERNVIKAIAKMPKGHLRDSGLVHALLKIPSIEQLQTHPIMGRSFEGFIVEELAKGLEASMITFWSLHHYRTRAKAEIDLIIDSRYGAIPVEIKHSQVVKEKDLRTIKDFINEHNSPFGLLVNNSDNVEQLADRLFQIPSRCV